MFGLFKSKIGKNDLINLINHAIEYDFLATHKDILNKLYYSEGAYFEPSQYLAHDYPKIKKDLLVIRGKCTFEDLLEIIGKEYFSDKCSIDTFNQDGFYWINPKTLVFRGVTTYVNEFNRATEEIKVLYRKGGCSYIIYISRLEKNKEAHIIATATTYFKDTDFMELDEKNIEILAMTLREEFVHSNMYSITKQAGELWLDKRTNLMWQVEITCSTPFEYLSYVKKLNDENYGGYNNWRIPTISELRTISTKYGLTIDKNKKSHFYITPFLLASFKEIPDDENAIFLSSDEGFEDCYGAGLNFSNLSVDDSMCGGYLRCVRTNN
jgi:hypothetical protein